MTFVTRDLVTGLRRGPIRYPDGKPPEPYGCRWCGRPQGSHGMNCLPGRPGFTPPTTAQTLARMTARRAARLAPPARVQAGPELMVTLTADNRTLLDAVADALRAARTNPTTTKET